MIKLILLLFITLVSLVQVKNNVNINYSENGDGKFGMGIVYQGDGVFTISESTKRSGFGAATEKNFKQAEKRATENLNKFLELNEYTHKLISSEKFIGEGGILGKVFLTFKVFNKDGELFLNKDDAKRQLTELKEYLDLGIITQEEYEAKSLSLKKILLD